MLIIPKHRIVLFNLINGIFQSDLRKYLGFKGGTMAYFFYELNRFSVDLDFDLLSPISFDVLKEILLPILKDYGAVNDISDKKNTYFFLLSYEQTFPKIKVEISKRTCNREFYVNKSFYGVEVPVLKEDVALSSKILACLERKRLAPRDFYDVYFYLNKNVLPNEKYIFERVNKPVKPVLQDLLIKTNQAINTNNVLTGLGELVDIKQKAWIKNNLKRELTSKLGYLIKSTV